MSWCDFDILIVLISFLIGCGILLACCVLPGRRKNHDDRP